MKLIYILAWTVVVLAAVTICMAILIHDGICENPKAAGANIHKHKTLWT